MEVVAALEGWSEGPGLGEVEGWEGGEVEFDAVGVFEHTYSRAWDHSAG